MFGEPNEVTLASSALIASNLTLSVPILAAPTVVVSVLGAGEAPPQSTTNTSQSASVPAPADQVHHQHDQNEIIVTGVRRTMRDVLGGVSVLDEAELAREVRPSIGESLASQPGVSASSFGPAASRPVLRGLSGDRSRILTDGIGSLDVSSSSADHAVAIDPDRWRELGLQPCGS